jgi:hypothetical protein
MPRPRYRLQLNAKNFGDQFVGTTDQLRTLLDFVATSLDDCDWYVGHVELTDLRFAAFEGWTPQRVGNIEALLRLLAPDAQFIWGVFLALPTSVAQPDWPEAISTEDARFRDIGSARLEIRAFDTTVWELYSSDAGLMQRVAEKFRALMEQIPDWP